MSAILDIYNSIANMEVDGVPCRDIDEVKLNFRKMPVRMLLPSTEGDMEFIAIGDLQGITWAIRDLCIFASVTKGEGIEAYSKAMVEYIALYMEQIKANRSPAAQCSIEGVQVQMGPIGWGDKNYWAVDITLAVREIL